MGEQVHLLRSLPCTRRDVSGRVRGKTEEVVAVARRYAQEYFDGDRKYGYGGYHYDGRWVPVARDILEHYWPQTEWGSIYEPTRRILDVGCAKGFLVYDLIGAGTPLGVDAYGLDISNYAVMNCHPDVVGRLHIGSADGLPFPDDSFDLVLSINTLHNLTRAGVIAALTEIARVSRGPAFVQVDSYRTPAEKALFEAWVLTAKWHGYPDEWLALFAAAGYAGDYDWTVVEGTE